MRRVLPILLQIFAILAVAGCSSPPDFVLDELALADSNQPLENEIQPLQYGRLLEEEMVRLFGTPDQPRVPRGVDLDLELLKMAAGAAGYEQRNGEKYLQRGLFRQHCASCHGITGNGIGPTAGMMTPYPRDFTAGVFKWKSSYADAKPTDADLKHVLERGVPGTAMASYKLLDNKQLDALVEYVKYLSLRGEVEEQLLKFSGPSSDRVEEVATAWREAESQVVQPDADFVPSEKRSDEQLAASIAAGRKLFASERTKCIDCHGAKGHGGEIEEMDMWNTRMANFEQKTLNLAESLNSGQNAEVPVKELVAKNRLLERRREAPDLQVTPRPTRARDLHLGVYGGGGEPIDLFRRLHQGIAGTPMPGQAAVLTEEEIWQLVDYVRSLQ